MKVGWRVVRSDSEDQEGGESSALEVRIPGTGTLVPVWYLRHIGVGV
jgi:hypothetical protein